MIVKSPSTKTEYASRLINLETYIKDEDLIISKENKGKTYIGRVYAMSPLVGGGGEFAIIIQNIFKSCPDDSVVQVNLMSGPDHDAPEIYTQGKTQGGAMIQELVAKQKNVLKNALKVGWQEDVPLLNKRTLLISLAIPVKAIDEATISESSAIQADFLNNMRGCGFVDAAPLKAAELVSYYRSFASIFEPRKDVELDDLLELKHQIFGPDQVADFTDRKVGVFDGDTYCTAVTAKSFPEKAYPGLMSVITGAPFNKGSTREGGGQRILTPFIFNTTIRVANQRKEMDRVIAAIRSRRNTATLPFKLGNEDPHQALVDLEYMKKKCSGDGDKFVYVSTTAFLFGKTKDQAISAAMTLKGTFDKLQFDGRLVQNNGLVRWAQALPLNFSPAIAEKLSAECIMPSSAAGWLLPVYGDHTGNAQIHSNHTGSPFITRRGAVLWFDEFVSDNNFNGLIAAASGSGKSFALQYKIKNALAEGTNVFLFENGGSTKKFCTAAGGEYNEFSIRSEYMPSLNPFTGLSDDEFDEQQEGITSLLMLMAFENEPPTPGARIAMSEAVRAAWGRKQDEAEISDVLSSLDILRSSTDSKTDLNEVDRAAVNLIPRIKAFLDSPTRGRFFRGKATLNPKNQFTVFDLAGLAGDEHLRKCVMFFVLNSLMSRLRKIKGRKLVLVDEAHDVFKDPASESVMEGIYLKGRKDTVGVFVIVQSLLKLAETPAGRVIMNQSAWKLIMYQKAEEVRKLFKDELLAAFAGDPYFRRLVESVVSQKGKFSEILFVGDNYYEVGRLYVDKFTATMFSTEGEARDGVFALMEQGVSAVDAIYTVMKDKKRSRMQFLETVASQLRFEDPNLSKAELLANMEEILK